MINIIVILLIAASVAAAVRYLIKNRGSCSCGCSSCTSKCCGKRKS